MDYLQKLLDCFRVTPLEKRMEIMEVFSVAPLPKRKRKCKKFTVQSPEQLNQIGGMAPLLPPVVAVREDN